MPFDQPFYLLKGALIKLHTWSDKTHPRYCFIVNIGPFGLGGWVGEHFTKLAVLALEQRFCH